MAGIELGNARVLHPGKLRWLRALGWMALLFVGLAAAYVLVMNIGVRVATAVAGGTFTSLPTAPEAYKFGSVMVAVLVLLGLYTAAVRWGERRRPSELALAPLPLEFVGGLAIGLGLMAATVGILGATGWASVTSQPIVRVLPAIRGAMESGILEETLFRLVVFRLLWRAAGPWWALAISAALFGILHILNPNATLFAALCIALEAGILLAGFYVLTGRAWLSIGVHAGWNFAQGWLFGAAVSGGSGPFTGGPMLTQAAPGVSPILSGGAFGPEASLPGLVVCTAAGIWVFVTAWRRGGLESEADRAGG